MPAQLDRIRRTMKVAASPRDKGLVLTIEVVAYDNGIIQVDGVPMEDNNGADPAMGWLSAAEVISIIVTEFYRQVQARRRAEQ